MLSIKNNAKILFRANIPLSDKLNISLVTGDTNNGVTCLSYCTIRLAVVEFESGRR